jgi:predicted transcriptional regulator
MEKQEQINSKLEPLLGRLAEALNLINRNLESIIALNKKILKTQKELLRVNLNKTLSSAPLRLEPDAMTLLSLPMSLRKTVMALYKLEKATAEEIAKETNRLRAVESSSANQLVRMGYLKKTREGRDVYFYIEPPLEIRK